MSRTEELKEGRVPLHTLRADIDYGFTEAQTTFGKIGVKVWIYQGMVYSSDKNEDAGMLARKTRRDGSRDERGERKEGEDHREHRERRDSPRPASARPSETRARS